MAAAFGMTGRTSRIACLTVACLLSWMDAGRAGLVEPSAAVPGHRWLTYFDLMKMVVALQTMSAPGQTQTKRVIRTVLAREGDLVGSRRLMRASPAERPGLRKAGHAKAPGTGGSASCMSRTRIKAHIPAASHGRIVRRIRRRPRDASVSAGAERIITIAGHPMVRVVVPMSRRGGLGECRQRDTYSCDCGDKGELRLVDHHPSHGESCWAPLPAGIEVSCDAQIKNRS